MYFSTIIVFLNRILEKNAEQHNVRYPKFNSRWIRGIDNYKKMLCYDKYFCASTKN